METANMCEHYDPRWTANVPNILTEPNLRIVEATLKDGWVCGFHLHYGAGDIRAFSMYQTYLRYVQEAKPGDLFILWSVPEMRRRKLLLVDTRYGGLLHGDNSILSTTDLCLVQEYLAGEASHEALAVASYGTTDLEAVLTDLGGSEWDRFLDLARRANVLGGALCVLPFTTVDRPEFCLLTAKRPNEKGEVPLGGAY